MASSTDRKDITKLHVPGETGWKNAPTPIFPPQNVARSPPSRSGSNPYGKNIQVTQRGRPAKGQRSSAGNPISRQTLAGHRELKEPPSKRQKMTHAGAGFGGSRELSKVLRQSDEVILVDDDSEEQQKKRSSQYLFPSGSRQNGKQTIHPSGEHTTFLDKFQHAASPVDLTADSDEIESYSDSPIPPSDPRLQGINSGPNVKKVVAIIESKTASSQVEGRRELLDLRTVPPPPGKRKMRKKFTPLKSPGTKVASPSTVPKGLDPIATSSSLKATPKPSLQPSLPVKEALIDAKYYSGEDTQLFITCNSRGMRLVRHQNDSTRPPDILYEVSPEENPDLQLQYGPTILQFSNKAKEGLVTISFDAGNSKWSVEIKDEVLTFIRGLKANLTTPKKQEMLWDAAQLHKEALLSEVPLIQEVSSKSDRMEELKAIEERKRKNPGLQLQSDKSEPIQPASAKRRETESNSISPTPAVSSTSAPANNRKNTSRSTKNESRIAEAFTAVRRSTRKKDRESEDRASDADDIMLVYPPGAQGAVTITKGDLARLEPGQYLNDTLIEFALKLWMTRLEQERPDIAQQVHVFSSFFYKKLNSKRDMRQAYENVRKWTSKFDIFKKKYIVVPINEHYHWYLAIIYEPEHMLSETAPEKPTARKATRLATKAVEAELADALMQSEEAMDDREETSDKPSVDAEQGNVVDEGAEQDPSVSEPIQPTSSEGEVERDLGGFEESVRIEDPELEEPSSKEGPRPHSPATLSYVSENAMEISKSRVVSPSASDFGKAVPMSRRGSNASINMSDPDEMLLKGGDVPIELSEENVALLDKSGTDADVDPGSPIAVSEVASASHGGGIPPKRFYQSISKKEKGKQKAKPKREVLSLDDDNAQDIGMDVDRKPRTVIFTLDSLGTSHKAAITKLSAYLQKEAEDKKGITNAGQAEGKQASVPAQPNFCDCGLYLIHFAQTFISDPVKYYGLSMAPRGKLQNKDAKEDWNDKVVQTMRADLAHEITSRSEEWLKTRPGKSEKEEKESDDDITILSQGPVDKRKSAAAQRSRASQKPPASKKPPVSQKVEVQQKPVDQKPVDPPQTESNEGPAERMR